VFATMSVTDNLLLGAFPRFTRARPKGDVQHDLEKAMELFPRLKERRTQLAGTLSGGEQQMLAMARAVMLNPDVVLLDEPSMGLAPILVEEVFRIITRLKSEGVTMLLVEQFAAAGAERGRLWLCAGERQHLRARPGREPEEPTRRWWPPTSAAIAGGRRRSAPVRPFSARLVAYAGRL
jgi:ABC-type branched-subunit amino acid transport system ATPase component